MDGPKFRVIEQSGAQKVTYECGCPCEPAARPDEGGVPGFEHCCCGKVHFVGAGAAVALDGYLADRRAARKREPDYARGTDEVTLDGGPVEVAWAFPSE